MFHFFRIISILEGSSYLAILSVTFSIISRDYIFHIGMFHGLLFMLYFILSLMVCNQQRWSLVIWIGLFLASIMPFAFIPVELLLRKTFTHASQN